ncbi:MAG: hypothetical protein HOV80_08375 [Polyangiaceae bacterium]|nr:hypothetical protein [Polyangiaceae bacterium]
MIRARHSMMLALAALSVGTAGCLGESDSAPLGYNCPTGENFEIVSQVFERRCGTLDCHGDPSRPLRFYGRGGLRLRLPDGSGPPSGTQIGTTPVEINENRFSACGLEPEIMDNVVAGRDVPESLTLIKKPRLIEAHKGGQQLAEGSLADTCIISWIQGAVNEAACDRALLEP